MFFSEPKLLNKTSVLRLMDGTMLSKLTKNTFFAITSPKRNLIHFTRVSNLNHTKIHLFIPTIARRTTFPRRFLNHLLTKLYHSFHPFQFSLLIPLRAKNLWLSELKKQSAKASQIQFTKIIQ